MTQFSFEWILSLNWLCQKWGQVQWMRIQDYFLVLLLLLASPMSVWGDCPSNQRTAIVFGNGIETSYEDANTTLYDVVAPAIRNAVGTSIDQSCITFILAYDSKFTDSKNNVLSFADFVGQLADALVQRNIDVAANFWQYFGGVVTPPTWFQDIQRIAITAATSVFQSDLLSHEMLYNDELAQGHNIVVIAHSQGNLYVNQAYIVVTSLGGANSFHVVAVASPAPYVAGQGPHFTLYGDVITLVPGALSPNISNHPPSPCLTGDALGCHAFDNSYMAGDVTRPAIVNAAVQTLLGCPPAFADNFNRPDGPAANGWSNTIGNVNGNLMIHTGALSTPGPDGRAGIYRPSDLSKSVTVSANLTQANGFGGLLSRYDADFLFGSNGTLGSGYGVSIHRGDQNFSDSAVTLVLNGVGLASLPSSFQFGSSISVTVTYNPDGSIAGSIGGSGSTFNFSFGPRSVALPGANIALDEGFPDGRSTIITNPTADNLTITYSCDTGLTTIKVTPILTNGTFMSFSCSSLPDAPAGYAWIWGLSNAAPAQDGTSVWGVNGEVGGGGIKPCANYGYILDLSGSPPWSIGTIPSNTDVYLSAYQFDTSNPPIKDGHIWPGTNPVYYGVVHWDGSVGTIKQ